MFLSFVLKASPQSQEVAWTLTCKSKQRGNQATAPRFATIPIVLPKISKWVWKISSATSRRAANRVNHSTAVDAIGVAAEIRTASIVIITIARTDTETDRGRMIENMDTKDTAIEKTRTTTAAGNDTARDIAADRPDATRSQQRK